MNITMVYKLASKTLRYIKTSNPSKYILNLSTFPIVQDEERYYLEYNLGKWMISKTYTTSSKPKKYKKIALILESPHKSEFDIMYNPIRPANGLTGLRIHEKLISQPFLKMLSVKDIYEVEIMNAIQYQLSLYHYLNNLDPVNSVFINLWNGFSRNMVNTFFCFLFNNGFDLDFVDRLDTYNPAITVNACTHNFNNRSSTSKTYTKSNLSSNVNLAIDKYSVNINVKEVLYSKHPSKW